MSDLPPGWEWTTLEELAAVEPRAITDGPFGSNLKSNHYTESGARVIRLQNIGDGAFRDDRAYVDLERFEQLRAHEARPGDLVVASLGDAPPRACILPALDAPAIVKADCIRIRLHRIVLAEWALCVLQAPPTKRYAAGLIKGVGRPRLGLDHIRKLPIPLPPLAEQRRIVDETDDVLARIEAGKHSLRSAMTRLGNLEQRLLIQTTARSIRPASGDKVSVSPAAVDVHDGDLPVLPPSWRWVRLHEIADVVGGVTKDASKQSDPAVPLVPYLRVANVQRGYLDLREVSEIRVSEETVKKLALLPGDVLLNEGGDRDKLGRGWIWEGQVERCIHQNHVFRVRIHDRVIHPKLLAWHANSFGQAWFEANGKQSVNLASISLRTIKLFPVPVPPPHEQREIVEYVEDQLVQIGRLREGLTTGLARAATLRRSLLADAFAGRLVPQDPTDEPASVLLDRIRAERAAQPKHARARRTTRGGSS